MKDKKDCHASKGQFCTNGKSPNDMGDNYIEAYITYIQLTHPTITLDDHDIVSIMDPIYSTLKRPEVNESKLGLYLFLAIAIGAVIIIAILLLIIYIKRKSSSSDTNETEDE